MSWLPSGRGLVILVVLVALPACGSGDDGSGASGSGVPPSEEAAAPGSPDVAELVGRLPADEQAAVVDLAAVREDLGLAADDDLTDTDDDAVRQALFAAGLAIPYLASPDVNLLLKEALDTGQIQAGASGAQTILLGGSAPDRAVALVATEQDPGEVLDRLRQEGWQEVADDIVTDEEASAFSDVYTAVGARDGFVVLGRDPRVVAEVLDREPDEPQGAAALLDSIDGPPTRSWRSRSAMTR